MSARGHFWFCIVCEFLTIAITSATWVIFGAILWELWK
jgi:hypothetical protein